MCVEGGFFFKISKRDFTFIRDESTYTSYVIKAHTVAAHLRAAALM